MKFDNLVVVTVLCHEHGAHEHYFEYRNMAPSQAVHLAMVDTPCLGDFTVSMTVRES